jgi:CubicO group peptidase (beta-lactamase class C family)
MSVAVLDRGQLVVDDGFGTIEAGGARVTRDTPFFIASVTKTFTGVLAAMAVDDGVLSFDDPPRKHVPGFHLSDPTADARVTLRDLLSHRFGLPQGVPDDAVGLGTASRSPDRANSVSPARTVTAAVSDAWSACAEADTPSRTAIRGIRISKPARGRKARERR